MFCAPDTRQYGHCRQENKHSGNESAMMLKRTAAVSMLELWQVGEMKVDTRSAGGDQNEVSHLWHEHAGRIQLLRQLRNVARRLVQARHVQVPELRYRQRRLESILHAVRADASKASRG